VRSLRQEASHTISLPLNPPSSILIQCSMVLECAFVASLSTAYPDQETRSSLCCSQKMQAKPQNSKNGVSSNRLHIPRLHSSRALPPRPATPETVRKRLFILVHRTPEKPREAPVAPTTSLNIFTRGASPVTLTPQESSEIPVSTASARLDGKTRREGNNTRYDEAVAIERGREGRRGRG
jgi:hypothetical protein